MTFEDSAFVGLARFPYVLIVVTRHRLFLVVSDLRCYTDSVKRITVVMANITRENFDKHWLLQQNAVAAGGFNSVEFREAKGTREAVQSPLLSALYDHHIHPERVAAVFQRLKYEKAADVLIKSLPKASSTRKGNFGEVVASEHLRQRHGYKMPVFKLRYSDNPQMPQRGEDIVAFEIDERQVILKICIGEAKVRNTHNKSAVRDAHRRLSEAYHPYPVALSLIITVLHDRRDHALADQVDVLIERLADGIFPRTNWIFVITENQPKDAFEAITEEPTVLENLTCVHVKLDSLDDLIDNLFDSPIPNPDAD